MLLAILVHYAANMWIEKTKSPTRCYLDKTPSSPYLFKRKYMLGGKEKQQVHSSTLLFFSD